jgi:valyl-tRNA synthetase
VADAALKDEGAEARMTAFQELVATVRSLRKEYGIGEGQMIALSLHTSDGLRETLDAQRGALTRLARVGELRFERAAPGTVGAHAVLQGGAAELFLPLAGVIDVERERGRLETEVQRLSGQLEGVRKRLSNEQFVSKAPADVIAKAKEQAVGLEDQVRKLEEKLTQLRGSA